MLVLGCEGGPTLGLACEKRAKSFSNSAFVSPLPLSSTPYRSQMASGMSGLDLMAVERPITRMAFSDCGGGPSNASMWIVMMRRLDASAVYLTPFVTKLIRH